MTLLEWLLLEPEVRYVAGLTDMLCVLCDRHIAAKARSNHDRVHLLEHLAEMAARPPEFVRGPTLGGAILRAPSSAPPLGAGEVAISARVIAVTDKAILVASLDGEDDEIGRVWVPKRALDGADLDVGDRDEVVLPAWFVALAGDRLGPA